MLNELENNHHAPGSVASMAEATQRDVSAKPYPGRTDLPGSLSRPLTVHEPVECVQRRGPRVAIAVAARTQMNPYKSQRPRERLIRLGHGASRRSRVMR